MPPGNIECLTKLHLFKFPSITSRRSRTLVFFHVTVFLCCDTSGQRAIEVVFSAYLFSFAINDYRFKVSCTRATLAG